MKFLYVQFIVHLNSSIRLKKGVVCGRRILNSYGMSRSSLCNEQLAANYSKTNVSKLNAGYVPPFLIPRSHSLTLSLTLSQARDASVQALRMYTTCSLICVHIHIQTCLYTYLCRVCTLQIVQTKLRVYIGYIGYSIAFLASLLTLLARPDRARADCLSALGQWQDAFSDRRRVCLCGHYSDARVPAAIRCV